MNMVQIIGVPLSNYVRTVRIAAEEMGIYYELVPEFPHTPVVNAIHPLGKVPAMRHGDFMLCESRAIIAYFEHVLGGRSLMPVDPRQACRVEQWVSMSITTLLPHMVSEYLAAYLFPGTSDGMPDRARVDAALPRLETYLGVLEREAGKTGFIGAESFSLADAYLIPALAYLKDRPESGAIIESSPGLTSYIALHEIRPSVKAAASDEIPVEARTADAQEPAIAAA